MGHSHGHTHSHGHHHDLNDRNLLFATLLNAVITVAEIIGGLLSNSLALLSDAIHNLGDTIAVMLAYFANLIGRRDANEKKTFGYKRAEILAALFNAVVLITITLFLFIEAYKRFQSPEPIKAVIMFWVALVGLIANFIAVVLLRKDSQHNINIRAAYLHLLGDTVSSVAVILGSVFIFYFDITWIDPVITFLIGIYILKETYTVLRETVNILMQGTPESIDLMEVVKELEERREISNIHHVHSWRLDDKQIHFECHIDLDDDYTLSQTDKLRSELEEVLLNKYGISHVTIQMEFNCCDQKGIIHKKV
ncbi:MAG: cation transporter [Bacteroidales bacterium]|nr:cation transporter [Bacteroidales bacterium]